MGTRCKIGYKESGKDKLSECFYKLKGNAITATYCHYDGYLNGVGCKLLAYYSDPQSAFDLSTVGYITALHETKEESIRQSDWPPDSPELYSCIDEYKKELYKVDFLYLYDLGKKTWQYYTHIDLEFMDMPDPIMVGANRPHTHKFEKYSPKEMTDFMDIPYPTVEKYIPKKTE